MATPRPTSAPTSQPACSTSAATALRPARHAGHEARGLGNVYRDRKSMRWTPPDGLKGSVGELALWQLAFLVAVTMENADPLACHRLRELDWLIPRSYYQAPPPMRLEVLLRCAAPELQRNT